MIARVFPSKNSNTPDDEHAYFDVPDLLTPVYDEVHVSVTFTWDIDRGYELMEAWKSHGKTVKIGGVAIDGESTEPFKAGMYLKNGITITSRGCPNACSFCMVNKGKLIEFDEFPEGNIIQDNNILACSDAHWDKVITMLRRQKAVEFKGGLEAARVTQKKAEDIRSLKIKSVWLACDSDASIKPLEKAIKILRNAGLKDSHFYCYVLIGKEEQRLRAVRDMGVMPFAQLYQAPAKHKTVYTKEMKQYQRLMARPAITRNVFKA